MKKLLAGLLLILAASARAQQAAPKPFLEGQHSGVKESKAVAVQDEAKWKEIWREHDASAPAPEIDFSKENVVVVFVGRTPTAGVKVTIVVQQDPLDPNRLNVFYRETIVKKGFSAQVQSEPYAMVKVPRAGTIDVEKDVPVSIPERRPGADRQPQYDDTRVKALIERMPSFDGN